LEEKAWGNMPSWALPDPLAFWQAADQYERANGSTYREMEIALPRELSTEQRRELVEDFVQQELGGRHAYCWAIHCPPAADGKEQPHLHLMFSERLIDGIDRGPEQYFKRHNPRAPEKGGCQKGFGPRAGQTLTKAERVAELKALRARWEAVCNAHLERAGARERIDMRCHAERGTGLEPEPKQLPSQWRGQGRAEIIEFRKARALAKARQRAAEDAQASAEREKIDQERRRRIADLAQVERNTAGAAYTFARNALEAIRKAGGDADRVDWRLIEARAIVQALSESGQDEASVIGAINRHSPERVDPASHQEVKDAVKHVAARLRLRAAAEASAEAERDNDNDGPPAPG
jgi:hypothetical protein